MNTIQKFINQNMSKLNRSDKYYLYCASGFRSLIAASILKSRGIHNVIDVQNGFKGISEVENRSVVEELANDPALSTKDYGIIHYVR